MSSSVLIAVISPSVQAFVILGLVKEGKVNVALHHQCIEVRKVEAAKIRVFRDGYDTLPKPLVRSLYA